VSDHNTQLNWTEEQWNRVRQVVYEEARKTRVAGNLLPLYGPLEPDATTVPHEKIEEDPERGISVNDTDVLKLSTLQELVYLKTGQVSDPNLESALLAFRRAANQVARLEDDVIFRGQVGPDEGPPDNDIVPRGGTPPKTKETRRVKGGQRNPGLLDLNAKPKDPGDPNALVQAVSNAISALENNRYFSPFFCVLSAELFDVAQTSTQTSVVTPHDRILKLLNGGSLVRSSSLLPQTGLVISGSGEPIDLVVASDISVKFLQVTLDPLFVFRVSEKIVLRVRQEQAVRRLS